jgi:glucan phosphoethanolaminetransferase (alkaline phosphatase superfamily)
MAGCPADRARLHKWSGAMSILIGVLITFVVVILVLYLVNMLPLDARAKQIVQVIVIIIGIISLLKYLAVF